MAFRSRLIDAILFFQAASLGGFSVLGQYPPGHSGDACLALRLNSRMSHCAMRICSRSCHAVWGAPSGLTPRSLAGKSLNTLSKATCALPLFNKATTCSRTGSFMVFQPPKRYKDHKFISLMFLFCGSLWPSHFFKPDSRSFVRGI